ncbi:heparinase II/III family protein [Allopusillimonas ginsengisoli]|uniref:heparinase II/III family protein n=1 Tax=Allopusillimonas ginsengisoli TaxID=453575 RepID=UPI0010228AB3|nr:heparinase II/III-family protein [Allopusillimonas ginsengisoli]TEA79949.1 heparinase [Allopusillimonas ginsengisoli]
MILVKIRTLFLLGLRNVARVLIYRLSIKTKINPVLRLKADIPHLPFFFDLTPDLTKPKAPYFWTRRALYFGFHEVCVDATPPCWHNDPFKNVTISNFRNDWWAIPDFETNVTDIKVIWEASRFDWVISFVQRGILGDPTALHKLNTWIDDWILNNPPYKGANWKCGQEASIRVIHLAMGALLSNQIAKPCLSLLSLIEIHLKRIAPTIDYALGQNNNHGTSEAAALFIGGGWLATQGNVSAKRWETLGRRLLEDRVEQLISPDGSFSQYSLNYHRLMMDTLSIVELWRRKLNRPRFDTLFYQRACAAAVWLDHMLDIESGDGPNFGANDGAHLLPIVDTDYRDYRPSVHLSMTLFVGCSRYNEQQASKELLRWLGLVPPTLDTSVQRSVVYSDGGYAVLRRERALALLRFPRFRFKPSQSDALHLDLWVDGLNLLRDAGSYSYNSSSDLMHYFSGTHGHNTVQFDGRDQMPRISRFLFGDWLKTNWIKPLLISEKNDTFGAGYRDRNGVSHKRLLELHKNHLTVTDNISGFKDKAILRWRLAPVLWELHGLTARSKRYSLEITSNQPIDRFELVDGWESLYYLHKTKLPVLELETHYDACITTIIRWT